MEQPRVHVSILQMLNPYSKTIKKCHYKCQIALKVASCSGRVACKECGAYGMLHDMRGVKPTSGHGGSLRGRPW